MGKIVANIVLTGGPCAGKTTALAKIEEYYQERGYKVLIVNESATELINGGIKPFGEKALDILKFQEVILKYQISKERIYKETASQYGENEKIIIIYDRGLIDNKAYIGQEKFDELLKKLKMQEIDIMDSYDMVIHLVTAADGAKDAYTLSNNSARTETIDQAIALDKKTINAWAGHQNLKIIDNRTEFAEKMLKVIESINTLIDAPTTIRRQKKYLIDLRNSNLSFLNKDNSTLINLYQYYLNNIDSETRLRIRDYNGSKTYYITIQKKLGSGKSNVIINRKISKKIFDSLISAETDMDMIEKKRYSFTIDKQYYKLDIFDDCDYAILEVEPSIDNYEISIPNYFNVIEEVTNQDEYDNSKLAKENVKVLVKGKK